jgi:uncharacterized YigZ family protein
MTGISWRRKMTVTFNTILKREREETIVNKSRFIAYTFPVEKEEEASKHIQEIKTKHKDASHNVFAYIIGKKSNIQRYSDDGEPSGTAGIPMLNYLKGMELTNTLVVVTRYFGGIKLGTGGLARAYSKSAKSAVEKSQIVEAREYSCFKITLDYTLLGKIDNYLNNERIYVSEREYLEKVNIELIVENEKFESVKTELRNLTSGNINVELMYNKHYLTDGKSILNV